MEGALYKIIIIIMIKLILIIVIIIDYSGQKLRLRSEQRGNPSGHWTASWAGSVYPTPMSVSAERPQIQEATTDCFADNLQEDQPDTLPSTT